MTQATTYTDTCDDCNRKLLLDCPRAPGQALTCQTCWTSEEPHGDPDPEA